MGDPVTTQLSLDLTARRAAEHRRETGIARAQRNAGHDWQERAIGYLLEWIAAGNRGPFLCEDVRAFAERSGLDAPPTKRAWGAVMTAAKGRGVVRAVGYAPANSSNRSPKVSWVAA